MKKTYLVFSLLLAGLATEASAKTTTHKHKGKKIARVAKAHKSVSAYSQMSCPSPVQSQKTTEKVEIVKEVQVPVIKEVVKEVRVEVPVEVIKEVPAKAQESQPIFITNQFTPKAEEAKKVEPKAEDAKKVEPKAEDAKTPRSDYSNAPVVIVNHYGSEAYTQAAPVAPAPAAAAPAPAVKSADLTSAAAAVTKGVMKAVTKKECFDRSYFMSVMLGRSSFNGNATQIRDYLPAAGDLQNAFHAHSPSLWRAVPISRNKAKMNFAVELMAKGQKMHQYFPVFLGGSVMVLGRSASMRLTDADIPTPDYHKLSNNMNAFTLFHVGLRLHRFMISGFAGLSANMVRMPRMTLNVNQKLKHSFALGYAFGGSIKMMMNEYSFINATFIRNIFRVKGVVAGIVNRGTAAAGGAAVVENPVLGAFRSTDSFKARVHSNTYLLGFGVAV